MKQWSWHIFTQNMRSTNFTEQESIQKNAGGFFHTYYNLRRIGKKPRLRVRICMAVFAAMLGLAATGCSSHIEETLQEESKTAADASANRNGESAGADDSTNTGMGRYVEKNVLTLENWGSIQFQKAADGSLIMLDEWSGGYRSKDNGENWEQEPLSCYQQLKEAEESYLIRETAISTDGTVVMSYYQYGNEDETNPQEEDTGASDSYNDRFKTHYLLAAADGSMLQFEMDLPEESAVGGFCFSENGRLFAGVTNGKLFEINAADGTYKEVVTLENGIRYMNCCQNNILICVTGEDIYLYNIETNSFVEDAVLQDFIRDNYGGIRDYGNGYNVYLFGGEENIIYLAGEKGLHRHVIGGSLVEQVIDGGLSTLGDPSHYVKTAAFLPGEEFLALFSDGKIMKFIYDAAISALPGDKLTVYSLEENDTVRQAISAFQTANPDIYVSYQIGMASEGVTREDALKKLSTGLMDGSGPDVLILDKMPYRSYMEKGILMDIHSLMENLDKKEGILGNLIAPLYQDNSLYMVPAEFRLPLIEGSQEILQNRKGDQDNAYQGIADIFEAARIKYPDADLINICSESGILRAFFPVCEPMWMQENGKIDVESLKEFLVQTKRIYDAQINGTPQEAVEQYQSLDTYYMEEYGCTYEEHDFFTAINDFDYISDATKLACGMIGDIDDFASVFSQSRIEGFEDTVVERLNGQAKNIYYPLTLTGINAATKNREKAVLFLQTLLGEEVQKMTHLGFPVNKKAFENSLQPTEEMQERITEGNGAYMSYGGTDKEGKTFIWSVYWLDNATEQQLKDWITQSDTPYLQDIVLEEAVLKEGAKYLDGSQNLDAAVKAIADSVAIYMAE